MSTNRLFRTAICVAALILVSSDLFAQGSALWGRDFYTAFPANEHTDYMLDASRRFELLISTSTNPHLIVSAPAAGFSLDTMIEPNSTATISLPPSIECQTDEIVDPGRSVHITTDADVQVEAIDYKSITGDAWSVFPSSKLGTSYRTLNLAGSTNANLFGVSALLPSEFLVVGTRANTSVTITPTVMTAGGQTGPITVTLNAGDVYQVMGQLQVGASDLTGSVIVSDKPVVVLSGHRRTESPTDFAFYDNNGAPHSSRDFICEQMPAVNAWSKSALVVPIAPTKPLTLVRVLSATDNNTITVDGVVRGQIRAGEFLQIDTASRSLIEGSAPILVGEYLWSADSISGLGDPSLTIADRPPVVGGTHHLFATTDNAGYSQTFATIIAKTSDVGSISIDGNAISPLASKPIGTSGYSAARVQLTGGDHIVSANVPYTASMCALGQVTSYAYTLPTSLLSDPSLAAPAATVAAVHFSVERIAPNPILPANGALQVYYSAPVGTKLQWSLCDAAGRELRRGTGQSRLGVNDVLSITMAGHRQSGVCLLSIIASEPSGEVRCASVKVLVAQ